MAVLVKLTTFLIGFLTKPGSKSCFFTQKAFRALFWENREYLARRQWTLRPAFSSYIIGNILPKGGLT